MKVRRIHHVAYRCNDARETVDFYRDVLGMEFELAFAEDTVPSTGEQDPYMHVFLDAGMGNVLAFFELPHRAPMGRDPNTPPWVQHIAFEVESPDALADAKARLEAGGHEVLGPVDHGIFDSLYFFDPNGHRLELACNKGGERLRNRARAVAEDMLAEWTRTKRAPRHARWLHDGAGGGFARMTASRSRAAAREAQVSVLHDPDVPWFPRHVAELDRVAHHTLDAGSALPADHPGFGDPGYRRRRARIGRIALGHRHDAPFPVVRYTATETETWGRVYRRLAPLRRRHACRAYLAAFDALEEHCGFGPRSIPQGRDVSAFLKARTGFTLRPVAGLLRPRDFLNALAFRVFCSTQYVRHHSVPFYTPEPDVCHELLGHAPMFADAAFAELSQEIGLASLGASDADIERLARCYWYSVEFGLLREDGRRKAYGAGLLSSVSELERACAGGLGEDAFQPWNPACAAREPYPITALQPRYFVADSLRGATTALREFCASLPRRLHGCHEAVREGIPAERASRRSS